MDLCQLKNSELGKKFGKDNGRVALRGEVVKDIQARMLCSPSRDLPRHHMTAATVLDAIS